MTNSITDIIRRLSAPVPDMVKTKTLKGTAIKFLEWHAVVRILDQHAPGWHSEVKQVISEAGKIACIVRICIPCAEGLVWREAIGNEDDDSDAVKYGDPFSNAQAMAFKRAAAMFGVGLYLYSKDAPQAAQRPAQPQAPQRTQERATARPEPSGSLCSPMQQRTIAALLKATGRTAAQITEHYKVAQLGDLTEAQADKAIARLRTLADEAAAQEAAQHGMNAGDVSDVLAGVEDRPNMTGARSR